MQTYQFTHEGKTYRFQSDKPPEEARRIAKQRIAEMKGDEGGSSSLLDIAGSFTGGINDRLMDIAEPIVEAGTAAVGGPLGGVAGRRTSEVTRDAIVPDVEQDTFVERAANRAGEFVGDAAATLPLLLGGGAAVRAGGEAAARGAGTMERIARQFLSRGAAMPSRTAASEVTGSAAAGAGAQAGGEMTGSPAGEVIGALAGGFAGDVTPGRRIAQSAVNRGRRAYDAVTNPRTQKRAGDRAVSEAIAPEVENPRARGNARRAGEIERTIGDDFSLSVAEATESPSLIRTQEAYEAGLTGSDLANQLERRRINELAIEAARRRLAPGQGSPEDVATSARRRLDRVVEGLDRADEAVNQRARRQADRLRTGPQAETGRKLRERLQDERANRYEEMQVTAREMGLDDETPRYEFGAARGRLVRELEATAPFDLPSDQPGELLEAVRNAPDRVSVRDLRRLRSQVLEQINQARRSPQRSGQVPRLQRVREQLDALIGDTLRRAGDDELAESFDQFTDLYRRDYAEVYEQGVASRLLDRDANRAFRIRDEEVASELFKAGDEQAATRFRQIFGDSGDAQELVRRAAMDDIYGSAVGADGELSPQKLATWIRRNRNVLQEFPQIAREVSSVEGAVKQVGARRAALRRRRQAVESNLLARELRSVEGGAQNPEILIRNAVQNPTRMQRLIRSVESRPAKAALARSVWELVLDSSNPGEMLRRHRENIVAAMGEDAYKNAETIIEAYRKSSLVRQPQGVELDPSPSGAFEAALGTSFNSVSSRFFVARSGLVSHRYVLMDLFGRAAKANAGRFARESLVEALYDPEQARRIADLYEQPDPEKLGRFFIRAWQAGTMPAEQDEAQ